MLPNSPGTIDEDYRGEIAVIVLNAGDAAFTVERGMRIAQAVLAPVMRAAWEEVDALDETARGAGRLRQHRDLTYNRSHDRRRTGRPVAEIAMPRTLAFASIAVLGGALAASAPAWAAETATPTQIVDALNKAFGVHPGFRANHAKGIVVEGNFKAFPIAQSLSKAAIFSGAHDPGDGAVLGLHRASGSA